MRQPSEETGVPETHRVLAIEDDTNAFTLLKIALRQLPLDIVNVNTGAQAIAFLDAEVPALIFLDIDLPDMHGWQVLERFKESGRIQQTPVVVLTAHREPVHRLIGSLQSVAVYLQKPFKPDELRDRVRQLLHL
jgi:DNA-binding response OmpR family regulator